MGSMAVEKKRDFARPWTLYGLNCGHFTLQVTLFMAPPQLTIKWCRETLSTLPRVRVFLIDGVRNGVGSNGHTGVNEVRFRNGRIVREGLQTILSDLRLRKQFNSNQLARGGMCHKR